MLSPFRNCQTCGAPYYVARTAVKVAAWTPNGLVPYIPPAGESFMAKNAKHYPRMCLIERLGEYLPGVPSYLLVYSYAYGLFSGFQSDKRTAPVSGAGTISDVYGNVWNFTYSGTEVDTLEVPYVLRSRSLYLSAYDAAGRLVSHRSLSLSSQFGGNVASAIGYNGAQLIAMLWNNPSRLIKSVLNDVQRDSRGQ
jgi:hypothetical protein